MEKKLACGRTLAASVIGASLLWGCGGGGSGGYSMPLPTAAGGTATAPPAANGSDPGTVASGTSPGPDAGASTPTVPVQEKRIDIPLTQYVNLFVGTKISDTGSGHSGNVNPGAQTVAYYRLILVTT